MVDLRLLRSLCIIYIPCSMLFIKDSLSCNFTHPLTFMRRNVGSVYGCNIALSRLYRVWLKDVIWTVLVFLNSSNVILEPSNMVLHRYSISSLFWYNLHMCRWVIATRNSCDVVSNCNAWSSLSNRLTIDYLKNLSFDFTGKCQYPDCCGKNIWWPGLE